MFWVDLWLFWVGMNLFFVSSSPLILIPAFVLCEGCSDEDKLLLQVDGPSRLLCLFLMLPPHVVSPTRSRATPANLMWCAQNTCNCSRHKSISCIVLFECAISLLLCCLMLASQEGNHGYKLRFLSSWIVMITIWFHFLLCIQCSLSHRCPYIHSSDLLFLRLHTTNTKSSMHWGLNVVSAGWAASRGWACTPSISTLPRLHSRICRSTPLLLLSTHLLFQS